MPEEKPLLVDFVKEDALSQIYPCAPVLSSHKAGWNGILLEYHRQPRYEMPECFSVQHVIGIPIEISSPYRSERRLDGCFQSEQISEGDILVIPAHNRHWNYSDTQEDNFIVLSLEPIVFARTIYESIDPDRVELVPHFVKPDPLIHGIGLALKAELESGRLGGCLYAESMATALFAHLLRWYSAQNHPIREYTGGLPKYKLRQVIDYINNHLDQDLGLAKLAELVQMSPHYFARLFKQSTEFAPHQYVIRCRVERAKQLLLQGKLTIAQVAYAVGFAHQSHLNRHFKRWLGVTPKALLEN